VVDAWNLQVNGRGASSKYVTSVLANDTTGVITITYDANAVGLAATQNVLALAPWIRSGQGGGNTAETLDAALAAGRSGAIDWACVGETNASAVATGVATAALGTTGVRTRFSPSACR
jgi:type IV pilus assembly protein PilA